MTSPRPSLLHNALSSMDLNRSWGRGSPLTTPTYRSSPLLSPSGHASPLPMSAGHPVRSAAVVNVTSLVNPNDAPVNQTTHTAVGHYSYASPNNPECQLPFGDTNQSSISALSSATKLAPSPISNANCLQNNIQSITKYSDENVQTSYNINEEMDHHKDKAKKKQVVFSSTEEHHVDQPDPNDVNWSAILTAMAAEQMTQQNKSDNMGGRLGRRKRSVTPVKGKGRVNKSKGDDGGRGGRGKRKKNGNISDVYDILYDLADFTLNDLALILKQGGVPVKRRQYKLIQTVQVRVVFEHVQDVDTINQQFDAKINITARWQEKQFAGWSEDELAAVEFHQCWNPEFMILNLEGALNCEHANMIIRYEPEHAYPVVTYMWHVAATFREPLELEHFPLDTQELSIALTSARPSAEIELVEDYLNVSYLSPRAFKSGMFDAYSFVSFVRDYRMSAGLGAERHPVLIASCHCRRRIGYYMWNIFLIVFLIFLLSLIILAIDPTGTDRVSILLTLFLTTVAFKLVMSRSLPAISYLTYLDMYIVFLMVYLALQAFVDAFWCHLGKYRSREKIIYYDEIVQSLMVAMMILGHLTFFVYIQSTAMAKRRDLFKRDFEHQMGTRRRKDFALQNTNQYGGDVGGGGELGSQDKSGTDARQKKGGADRKDLETEMIRKDSQTKGSRKSSRSDFTRYNSRSDSGGSLQKKPSSGGSLQKKPSSLSPLRASSTMARRTSSRALDSGTMVGDSKPIDKKSKSKNITEGHISKPNEDDDLSANEGYGPSLSSSSSSLPYQTSDTEEYVDS